MQKRKNKRWIQRAFKKHKRGALHKQLGIPLSKTIPIKTLEIAAKKLGVLGRRARLALNLRRMQRRKKK
jgi:hypothetical protein